MQYSRIRIFVRVLVWSGLSLLLLTCAGAATLAWLFNAGHFDSAIRDKAFEQFGLELEFEKLGYSFPGTVTVQKPKLRAAGAGEGVVPLSCEGIRAHFDLGSISELRVSEVEFDGLALELKFGEGFRLTGLPGGLEQAVVGRGAGGTSSGDPAEPTRGFVVPVDDIPQQVSFRDTELSVELPNGEKGSAAANITVQSKTSGGTPGLSIDSAGTASLLGAPGGFSLSVKVGPRSIRINAKIGEQVEVGCDIEFSGAGAAREIRLPPLSAAVNLTVAARAHEFEALRRATARLGLELPEVRGLVSGTANLKCKLEAPDFWPDRVELRPDLSVRKATFPLPGGQSVAAEELLLKGDLAVSLPQDEFEVRWTDLALSVSGGQILLGEDESFAADQVALTSSGSVVSGAFQARGDYRVLLGEENVSGAIDVDYGPAGLSLKRFSVAHPTVGEASVVLRMDAGFGAIEAANVAFSALRLPEIAKRLASRLPAAAETAESIAQQIPDGPLSVTLQLSEGAVPTEDWPRALKESRFSVEVEARCAAEDETVSAALSLGIKERRLVCEGLQLKTPLGNLKMTVRSDEDWRQLTTVSATFDSLDTAQCLARLAQSLPPELEGVRAVGGLSGQAELKGVPFPFGRETAQGETGISAEFELRPDRLTCQFPAGTPDGGDSLLPGFETTLTGKVAGKLRLAPSSYRPVSYSANADLALSDLRLALAPHAEMEAQGGSLEVNVTGGAEAIAVAGNLKLAAGEERITTSLSAEVKGRQITLSPIKLVWAEVGSAELKGIADTKAGTLSSASVRLTDLSVASLVGRLGEHLPAEIRDLQPEGTVSALIEADDLPFTAEAPPGAAQDRFSALQVQVWFRELRGRRALEALKPVAEDPTVRASLSGSLETQLAVDVARRVLTCRRLVGIDLEASGEIPIGADKLRAKASMKMTPGSLALEKLELIWPGEMRMELSGQARRDRRRAVAVSVSPGGSLVGDPLSLLALEELNSASLALDKIDLARLFEVAAQFLPEKARAYHPSGTLSAELSCKSLPLSLDQLPRELCTAIRLQEASLTPEDENLIEGIEGMDLAFDCAIGQMEGTEEIAVKTSLKLANAYLYRDVFLLDLADRDAECGFEGRGALRGFSISEGTGFVRIADEFRAEVSGLELTREPKLHLKSRLEIKGVQNARLLTDLREAFGEHWHWLRELEMAGGSALSADVDYRPDQTKVRGSLEVRDSDVAYGGASLEGLELSLPFSVGWPAPPSGGPGLPFGSLKIAKLGTGPLTIENLALSLKLDANRLMTQELDQTFFGGRLRVSALETTNLLSPKRRAEGRLAAENLRLEKLLQSTALSGLKGSVGASLNQVLLRDRSLSFSGEARVDLAGGAVEISNLAVRDMFSDLSRLSFDLTARGLSLEQVTTMVPGFGRMTGILEGEVTGLELDLSTRQPVRFDASFRTVKRRGIRQTISGEAIRSLSLTAGQDAGAKLLDLAGEHPYKAFGFAAVLRNDRLRFEGVSRKDNLERILVPPLIARTKVAIHISSEVKYQSFEKGLKSAIESIREAAETGQVDVKVD